MATKKCVEPPILQKPEITNQEEDCSAAEQKTSLEEKEKTKDVNKKGKDPKMVEPPTRTGTSPPNGKEKEQKTGRGTSPQTKDEKKKKSSNEPTVKSGRSLKEKEKAAASSECQNKSQMSIIGPACNTPTTKDYQFLEEFIIHTPFYHGFVAREDLSALLKNVGDFIVRTSVQANKYELEKRKKNAANVKVLNNLSRELCAKKEKEAKEKEAKIAAAGEVGKREFVISVNCKDKQTKGNSNRPNYTPIRNLVIKRKKGLISVEPQKKFKAMGEFFEWYKKNSGVCKETTFILSNPIPLSNWEYHHDDIELMEKKLGEGAFGEVRVGKLKGKDGKKTEVAVKMLRNSDIVSREQVVELLHEARVMRMMDHKNVLKSYGIAVLQEPMYLMSELCACGALREYLKENKETVTLLDKLNFVIGSARGVEYLHSQKTIHRDLAVRNILLAEDKTPKISDFGLAKVTERYEMKEQCKIPVRYLAPETLVNFAFTSKTDVFSFGCVIWEIYENGQQPHDGKNAQTIRTMTKKNQFLKLSASAPAELRKLVTERVFTADPENRCTMTTVVQCVEKLEKPAAGLMK